MFVHVLVKLTSHGGRLRERTAGKGKPRETVLLHVSTDKATHRLTFLVSSHYDLIGNLP